MALLGKKPSENPVLERFLEHCHSKQYAPRSVIIRAGDVPDTLYYIIEGSVSVMIEGDDGHEMVLTYLNKGDFIGEMGLFLTEERSALVKTRTECKLAEITYGEFHRISADDPKLIFQVAAQMAARLRQTSQKMADLAFLDVAGRIAHTLLDLSEQPDAMTHPEGMQIKITRQEIAKMVGCSREMAGRVLKELEEQGLLTAHGKTIVVFSERKTFD